MNGLKENEKNLLASFEKSFNKLTEEEKSKFTIYGELEVLRHRIMEED